MTANFGGVDVVIAGCHIVVRYGGDAIALCHCRVPL